MSAGGAPRLAFISCNETPWGGSEELWARTAGALAQDGAQIWVAKPRIDESAAPVRSLRERGARITDLVRFWPVPGRIVNFANFLLRPVMFAIWLFRLWLFLKRARPDLIILSQGGSWDGFYMGAVLNRFRVPYLLICQKASDLYWPPDHLRVRIRNFVAGASHVFFVSRHNHELLEQQIGRKLENASVVRNPFLVDYHQPIGWPDDEGPTLLACVGRLYPMEKGQDMLLRVLAQPKWLERNLRVDFYGAGCNREGLAEMAEFLGCTNVRFMGHVDDVKSIWASHHALILPSRAEGLPLVLVEAMLAGRVAIVSKAGGSAEVVDDGVDGFLMDGLDEASVDRAMERAWQLRSQWASIGLRAAAAIRVHVPEDPSRDLANQIRSIVAASGVNAADRPGATGQLVHE